MLPSVTTHSSFTKSVVMSVAVSKVGVVPCQISYYQARCQRQYYLRFSNTAHANTIA